jgi:hypothetical protein
MVHTPFARRRAVDFQPRDPESALGRAPVDYVEMRVRPTEQVSRLAPDTEWSSPFGSDEFCDASPAGVRPTRARQVFDAHAPTNGIHCTTPLWATTSWM